MPPPPSSCPGAGAGRSGIDRSTSGLARSLQLDPLGLRSGVRAAPHAGRSHSELHGHSSPAPSGAAEEDCDSVSGLVDLDRDGLFRSVLHLIEELDSVAPNQCKTSLAPIYGRQSESYPARHLPQFTGCSQSLTRLITCLFPLCLVLSLRTQIWLWLSLWRTRPFTGFSLFPVIVFGDTIRPPPHLFLACTPSRRGWPPSLWIG